MSSLSRRLRRLLPLTFAVAATVVPPAQAAPEPAATAATLQALHWQHENATYQATEDASIARTPARLIALHFDHENRVYRGREFASDPRRPPTAAVAVARDGFDWVDALSGAGSAVALIVLGVGANIGIRRRHGRYAHS